MTWSYLCRWHFYYARLRDDDICWCRVSGEDLNDKCDWINCYRKPYVEVFPSWKEMYRAMAKEDKELLTALKENRKLK